MEHKIFRVVSESFALGAQRMLDTETTRQNWIRLIKIFIYSLFVTTR
jgi:hypothetical protein